jgi:hypothetical protein
MTKTTKDLYSVKSYCVFIRAEYAGEGIGGKMPDVSNARLRMITAPPEHGFCVDLRKTDAGDLEILLNEQGRANFSTIQEERDAHGIHAALHALLEDHLCNGWEMVPPEDIGALTAAPIVSDEIVRDDEGRITEAGRVFWYPDYAVRDEIEDLCERSVLVLQSGT